MRTIERALAACAIALGGFGIMLIGVSPSARNSPVTLFFTSVTLYLSEAVLLLAFFVGTWCLCRKVVAWRNRHADFTQGYLLPNVSEGFLRRFAFFQIAFIGVWSVLFKGVLYTTLNPAYSHYLMAKSQSLGIAIPAECVLLLLCLVGLAQFVVRARQGRAALYGRVAGVVGSGGKSSVSAEVLSES
jgi:hypothetical protein